MKGVALRVPTVVLLGAALVAGAIVDRDRPAPQAATYGTFTPPVMAEVPPADRLSSMWLCPGGPADPAAGARTRIVAVNTGSAPATGTVTAYPEGGAARTAPLTLAGGARAEVDLTALAPGAFTGALVETSGGQVAVEQVVEAGTQWDASACAPAASDQWFYANGATTVDARAVLLVLNPFPDDAVVDFTFQTDDGARTPQALTGFVVPAGSLRSIQLTQQVQRREWVATVLRARTGRVVLGRVQSFDGSRGRSGLFAGVAAPSPGTQWWFPEAGLGAGRAERLVVYNPAERPASLTVTVYPGEADTAAGPDTAAVPTTVAPTTTLAPTTLAPTTLAPTTLSPATATTQAPPASGAGGEAGATTAPTSVPGTAAGDTTAPAATTAPAPPTTPATTAATTSTTPSTSIVPAPPQRSGPVTFTRSVGAGQALVLDLAAEATVPSGPFAVGVSSADVAVVVERAADYGEGSGRSGTVSMLGARWLAQRWLVAAGATADGIDEVLSIVNPGAADVFVTVRRLLPGSRDEVPGLVDVPVPPGGQVRVRLSGAVDVGDLVVLVDATGDVAVARLRTTLGELGASDAVAIPSR